MPAYGDSPAFLAGLTKLPMCRTLVMCATPTALLPLKLTLSASLCCAASAETSVPVVQQCSRLYFRPPSLRPFLNLSKLRQNTPVYACVQVHPCHAVPRFPVRRATGRDR